jgi:hypothetical protein
MISFMVGQDGKMVEPLHFQIISTVALVLLVSAPLPQAALKNQYS